jgi:hypothetical protein
VKNNRAVYENSGVRVMMGTSAPIWVAASHMTIEEARAFMSIVQRAISCYCHELEKQGAA